MDNQLTTKRLIRIWWAWQWRTIVATFVGSFVLIVLFALVAGFLGMSAEVVAVMSNLISLGVGIFASIYFLGFVLKKDFGDFSLSVQEKLTESLHEDGLES